MEIQVKLLSATATLPTYAHRTDAGMDLYASQTITILAQQRAMVPTGIALAIPQNYVGLVWDKSGLAVTNGLTTLAGVIDSGYRGELMIALYNTADTDYVVQPGQKIAQLLIQPVQQVKLRSTDALPKTDRGAHGFGSTGV